MSYAVLVLEQPWWDLDEDPGQTSVRDFLDGLSRLNGLPIFYATFYDTSSFDHALKYLLDARKLDDVKHLIVYIASHGAGNKIGNGHAKDMKLSTIFKRIEQHGKGRVAGLILDSCEVGGEFDTILAGMNRAKINWVMGYAFSIDWLTSILINMHVLAVMTSLNGKGLKQPNDLLAAVQKALGSFNPNQNTAERKGRRNALPLSEMLSISIRGGSSKAVLLETDEIWPAC
jgi:hypothetical protein